MVACIDRFEVSINRFSYYWFWLPTHGPARVWVGTAFYIMVGADGRVFIVITAVVVRAHVLQFFWYDEFVVRVGGENIIIRVFGVDGFGSVDGVEGEGAVGAVVVCSVD